MRLAVCVAAAACVLDGSRLAAAPARPAEAGPWRLAYRFPLRQTLRYNLVARVHGILPLFNSPEPVEAHAVIAAVYRATPMARQADGTVDVQLRIESADVSVEKVPVPLDLDKARQMLDLDVTFAPSGEVVAVRGGDKLPFNVTIPGVDPKRLYAVLFPVVFPDRPVRTGDTWPYKSELLGAEGTPAAFTATVLPPAGPAARGAATVRLRDEFSMPVDQRLDEARKPTVEDANARWHRQGKIQGSGVFTFNRAKGLVTHGKATIKADLLEKAIGDPPKDTPAEIASKVDAELSVDLLPAAAAKRAGTVGHAARGPR